MYFVRSYFDKNEPLTSWTLFSSLFGRISADFCSKTFQSTIIASLRVSWESKKGEIKNCCAIFWLKFERYFGKNFQYAPRNESVAYSLGRLHIALGEKMKLPFFNKNQIFLAKQSYLIKKLIVDKKNAHLKDNINKFLSIKWTFFFITMRQYYKMHLS